MSSTTTAPSAPTRSAMAVALPPGAAATSAIRSPEVRVEHRDERLARLVLWSGAALPYRREHRRIADATHDERVCDRAHRAPRPRPRSSTRLRARRPSLRAGSGEASWPPVRSSRRAQRSASSSPRSRASRSTSQSGYESATASLGGSGHGGPSLVSARSTALPNPRAHGERAATRRRSPTPPRGAARRAAVDTRRGGARPRTGGSSRWSGRFAARVTRSSRRRCARTVPYTRSVAKARSRSRKFESRSIDGRSTCAYAPSSMRTSASSTSEPRGSHEPNRTGAPCRPRIHASLDMRALPSGCTSSSSKRAVARHVRPPDLETASVDGGPGARPGVAGADDAHERLGWAGKVELELLDRQLVGRGGLPRLWLRCDRREVWERADQKVGADRDESLAQLPGGLLVVDRRRDAGEHRAGVEALLDLHDADAGLGISGEDRALDRRRAAPARQEREVHVHETERNGGEQRFGKESARTRRPRRPRRHWPRPRR